MLQHFSKKLVRIGFGSLFAILYVISFSKELRACHPTPPTGDPPCHYLPIYLTDLNTAASLSGAVDDTFLVTIKGYLTNGAAGAGSCCGVALAVRTVANGGLIKNVPLSFTTVPGGGPGGPGPGGHGPNNRNLSIDSLFQDSLSNGLLTWFGFKTITVGPVAVDTPIDLNFELVVNAGTPLSDVAHSLRVFNRIGTSKVDCANSRVSLGVFEIAQGKIPPRTLPLSSYGRIVLALLLAGTAMWVFRKKMAMGGRVA